MTERIPAVDAVRGLAILLVVIGHAVQSSVADFHSNPVWQIIYAFHMPLFMAVSGYVAGKVDLWQKFKHLVIPFVSWYLVGYLLVTGVALQDYIWRWIVNPDYGLWFLWALFLCFTVFWVAMKGGDIAVVFSIFVVFLVPFFVASPYVLNSDVAYLQWYYPFFALAYLAGKRPQLAVATGLLFVAVASRSFLFEQYVYAFGGIFASVLLILMMPYSWGVLGWFGRRTMDIYVSSQLFTSLVSGVALLVIVPLVLSLGLGELIRKSPLLSRVFLGIETTTLNNS
jgi:fucose 4-O-acetylase-like acetyltransferase